MTDNFTSFRTKMLADQQSESAIRAFEHSYRALERSETGMIPETSISPASGLTQYNSLPEVSREKAAELHRQTVVIKLNGGLGTGMGLEKAKSLLPVRDGMTFLDLIAKQILHLRKQTATEYPRFLLMNSFSTSADSKAALAKHPDLGNPADLEFIQNRVPKILQSDLSPASSPNNPQQEWCPPGHGDIYPSLAGSGTLAKLLAEGVKYAFVSNSDNLGADLDSKLLAWFAHSQAAFAMEVTRRTEMDRKGGHLARRKSDGRWVLRESAQCASEDQAAFEDISVHQFFNTNNLWLRLDALAQALEANGGAIPLPMIRNFKTLDPRDAQSPPVFQLETAMGAAIECFDHAEAIDVPRTRFAPVKTTADLVVVRSSACILTEDFRIELDPSRNGIPPVLELDGKRHKLVDGLDELLPHGTPCLKNVQRLKITGAVSLPPNLTLSGNVVFTNPGSSPLSVPVGSYEDTIVILGN